MRVSYILSALLWAIVSVATSTTINGSPASTTSTPTRTIDEESDDARAGVVTSAGTAPVQICTSSASARRSICNRAVMSIHKDGIDNEPYSVDIQQCACTSISKMIGCYRDEVQSKSQYLSSWSASSCAALITGRISEVTSGVTTSPTTTSRSSSRSISSLVVSTTSTGAASGRSNKGLVGWIEEVWILVLVGGLVN